MGGEVVNCKECGSQYEIGGDCCAWQGCKQCVKTTRQKTLNKMVGCKIISVVIDEDDTVFIKCQKDNGSSFYVNKPFDVRIDNNIYCAPGAMSIIEGAPKKSNQTDE